LKAKCIYLTREKSSVDCVAYNSGNQMTSKTKDGVTTTFTYDANGNRLSKILNGVTESYSYDDGDKMLSAGSKTYGYDLAGRTTSVTSGSNVTTLTYDYESRISTITGPGLTASYSYNGLDTRVSKIENATTTNFVRDGVGVTAPVVRDSFASYTPGVSERRNGVSTFNHSGLKNAETQTNSSSVATATRSYDAFGNVTSSTGTWKGGFGYAGDFGYQEDASGLKLLGHRYYDSSTGRFLPGIQLRTDATGMGIVRTSPVRT
jgi:RHS repeat-associated protein